MTTAQITEIMKLAEKINKANVTGATQQELVNLYGSMSGSVNLAMNAAKMVYFGKTKLTFAY